ncbi:ScbA/BarX family gamma-butyrolactone biosynthesis protein [Streptomyces coelicoflavus]|uniref:ScbA/BarX family gamma-butyrolactone biosynthesis protein n=1 Tax=Streptomyces coelicoflavus TaxID=285562 RepID=UPI001EF1B352|nr:ScbA/BarX family gamma-butyrolactone biosynthesis protein [Streptomyces coelicoflavus]
MSGERQRQNSEAGGAALPRLTTTVPREYVHRASHAEVFLTGGERLDESRFALTGQWPRTHTFFTSGGTCHDPLQAAETIRQTGLFLAHAGFDVPLDHQFLMWDLHITTHPEQQEIGVRPSELTILVNCLDLVRKGKRLAEFRMEMEIERAGLPCAAGGGRFTCVSAATYRRLRATTAKQPSNRRHPQRLVPPEVVGRTLPTEVVLATTDRPGRWLLDPDPRHPILFEHATDHYPGMVLLEAARQAAIAHSAPLTMEPLSMHAEFHRYAEYEAPVWIEVYALPEAGSDRTGLRIVGTQRDRDVFTATVHGQLTAPQPPLPLVGDTAG